MHLTEEQQRIVNHKSGHARVSAVAGSGKTTTMVARVGHLLEHGVSADEIMILMFNRSARDSFEASMHGRLDGLGCRLPEIRTFHSLGLRLVNSFSKRGVLERFQLVTEEYVAEKLTKQAANGAFQKWADEESYLSGEDIEEFLAFIDRVKASVCDARDLFRELGLPKRLGFFPEAFDSFEKARKRQRIRFYNDLIHEPLIALQNDSGLVAWVANRVDHIIVDEYQDINETQQLLLKHIAGSRARVMVVGDVDQCIYEWRGARPEYITTRFAVDFPNPSLYQLSYTFRYGHQLSLAANHLIAKNKKRDRKQCISHPSTANTSITAAEESVKHPVVEELNSWVAKGRSLSEAVVLLRLFGSSVPVELALLEANIPYILKGSPDIFESSEISALLGYLKVATKTIGDDGDEDTLKKNLLAMFSQPHLGIRREEMDVLVENVAAAPGSASQILLQWSSKNYAPFVKKRFQEAAETWRWLCQCELVQQAGPFLRNIVNNLKLYDFYDSFAIRLASAENRVKACEALIAFASNNKFTISELLAKIDEFRGIHRSNREKGLVRLLLTSVHRAKGLEWPLVILPGLEEGSFPFHRESEQPTELEDERRLFYVAVTRARERVVCIHPPDNRFRKSLVAGSSNVPVDQGRASRFLYESNLCLSGILGKALDERKSQGEKESGITCKAEDIAVADDYLRVVGGKIKLVASGRKKIKKGTPFNDNHQSIMSYLKIDEIAEGLLISHPSFGDGVVTAVNDRKQGRITVSFEEHGEMVLLVGYARLLARTFHAHF